MEANHIPNGELFAKPVMFDNGSKELSNLTQIVHSKLLENKLQTETLSSNLTTPADSVTHAMDPLDFHFFTGEYIGKPGMTDKGSTKLVDLSQNGHSESHALVMDPQSTTLRASNIVPAVTQVACSLSGTLQHLKNTPAANKQDQNISTDKSVDCNVTSGSTQLTHIGHSESGNANLEFPILTHVSSEQCSKAGRPICTSAASVSVGHGTPIIMPVTTYDEVLVPDKGRTSKPVNNTNNSEACRKSEKKI